MKIISWNVNGIRAIVKKDFYALTDVMDADVYCFQETKADPSQVGEALQGTRIGLPKGETELLDKVNEIIAEVREQGLYDTWYIQYTDYAKTLGVQ